ncbi:hypothetical protein EJ04DRAFT_580819 [Polyplosphaeria fusca]|uniref:Zn(2)-C6 fungal-type domain-containing protein n=1 Tax=Polyplosphaeria fusca TaxID=682080 RepID=A0A9P4UWD4_9PLEO|nr:hypothetical protein EJ04DRAFT_580819 [Polyplosphaeria fusca]
MTTEAAHRVVPPSRRREKAILSCNFCRRKKLKCDRQQPCKTCTDRGLSVSCVYTANPSDKSYNVHDRVDQLEKLVSSIMKARDLDPAPQDQAAAAVPKDPSYHSNTCDSDLPEHVRLDEDTTIYSHSGHWSSILDSIAEIREELDQIPVVGQPRDFARGELPGPDLLFTLRKSLTRNEILAAIPARAEADELLHAYFASMDMAFAILHLPSFRRQYEKFWAHPTEAPLMWIGTLFCIFALATRFQSIASTRINIEGVSDPADVSFQSARADLYREKAVHCMILGNYTKCPPFTLETFMLYFMCEYFRSPDSQFAIRILLSMVVQIAYRMGYHREPSRFRNITPFKAEMRRRIWASIIQLDLVSCSQLGLPKMVHESTHDVMQPRNLLDEDFDEDIQQLPQSRPDTDLTPMVFTRIRHRFLRIVSRIMEVSSSSTLPNYEDILRLDGELKEAYDSIPPELTPPLAKFLGLDNSFINIRRLYMGVGYMKALIQLHRPFHLLGRTDARYAQSRIKCVDAAFEILEFQNVLDNQTGPGGRLGNPEFQLRSSLLRSSSLLSDNFLFATVILCVDLDREVSTPMPVAKTQSERVRFGDEQPTRNEMVEALIKSYHIWAKASDTSQEAKTAADITKLVLRKAHVQVGSDLSTFPTDLPLPQFDLADFSTASVQYNLGSTASNAAFDFGDPLGAQSSNMEAFIDFQNIDWPDMDLETSMQEDWDLSF